MLLMVEKAIRTGLCHAINWYVDNKYMEDFGKNKDSPYLNCWDVKNLYV